MFYKMISYLGINSWHHILVSGIFCLYSSAFVFGQVESYNYYDSLLSRYDDTAFIQNNGTDSFFIASKAYHQYAIGVQNSSQGLALFSERYGNYLKSNRDKWAIEMLDSVLLWVIPHEFYGNKAAWGRTYLQKGYAEAKIRHYQSAIESYKKAEEVYLNIHQNDCQSKDLRACLKEKGDDKSYAYIWQNLYRKLVELYTLRNDYSLAISYLPEPTKIDWLHENNYLSASQSSEIHIKRAAIELNMGTNRADTLAAFSFYQKAYDVSDLDLHSKFKALLALGNSQRTLKRFEAAHRTITQVINYASPKWEKNKNILDLLIGAHLYKGYTYRDQILANTTLDSVEIRRYVEQGRNHYKIAVRLLEYESKQFQLAYTTEFSKSLGDISYFGQEYDTAETYYQRAIADITGENSDFLAIDSEKLKADREILYALGGLANVRHKQYLEKKDASLLKWAARAYEYIFEVEDDFRVNYPTQASRQIQQYRGAKRLKAGMHIAFDLWKLTEREESMNMALSIMDRSRALELQAHLQENSLADNLDEADKKLIAEINATQEQLYALELEASTVKKSDSLVHSTLMQKTRGELLQHQQKLQQQNPTYFRLKFATHTSRISDIQNKLKAKEVLVNYFWADTALYTLVVGQDFYDLEKQSITPEFKDEIIFITEFVQKPDPTSQERIRYQQIGYSLYERLLGNINKQGQELHSLVIVPDERLSELPFETLLTQQSSTSTAVDYRNLYYAWQKYLIRYQYVPHFLLKEGDTSNANDDLPFLYAGFAPTYNLDYESNLERSILSELRFNKPEIESVYQLCATISDNNKRFLDFDAREKAFLSIAPHAKLLHVAMHALSTKGSLNASHIAQPYLAFSNQEEKDTAYKDDDRLYMHEIYALNLQAELMVLSACNTGNGTWKTGEGILSLGRAFRMAGCRNIVSTLWNVNDKSSQKIIISFFEFLRQGLSKAEAMREAKKAYLFNSNLANGEAAPYYWAQFVLMGDNEELEALKPQNNLAYYFGILAILLILGGYWFYKRF